MKRTQTELAYLRATVQNASSVGLVIILFDQLISDLKRTIAAMENRDVETRSAELKHGFLVLAQLQGSLDMENGGEAAVNFARFYSAVRSAMMEAHLKVSPEILVRQIGLLLDVRQAWQQVDNPNLTAASADAGASAKALPQTPAMTEEQTTMAGDWTA
ncbi:MAG: flagellar export chaperone FliS [Terriglobales bacterium]